jgi:hypothetical protein
MRFPNQPMSEKPGVFHSIMPNFYGYGGHQYGYNLSLGRALAQVGWDHQAAIPIDNAIDQLPPGWIKSLNLSLKHKNKNKNIFQKFLLFKSGIFDLKKYFKTELFKKKNSEQVFFIESFSIWQFIVFCIAALNTPKGEASFWILFRYGPSILLRHVWLYKGFIKVLRLRFGSNLKLVTDSELIALSLKQLIGFDFIIFPIPHTEAYTSIPPLTSTANSDLTLWWPGEPRLSKGLDIVRKISQMEVDSKHPMKLIVTKSSMIEPKAEGIEIELTENILTAEKFRNLFNRCDFVLLPYDKTIYAESTSGIFVEAIVAGKITLVSADTWMAYELNKFKLTELVIEWGDKNLFRRIEAIYLNPQIRIKVKKMQKAYSNYHNELNMSKILAGLLPK